MIETLTVQNHSSVLLELVRELEDDLPPFRD